jgi:hypothetical protein
VIGSLVFVAEIADGSGTCLFLGITTAFTTSVREDGCVAESGGCTTLNWEEDPRGKETKSDMIMVTKELADIW